MLISGAGGGFSYPSDYKERLESASDYLFAANSDVADCFGVCEAINVSGYLDKIASELAEAGVSDLIDTLKSKTDELYENFTSALVAISTIFESFISSVSEIEDDIANKLKDVDASQIDNDELKEILLQYQKGEITLDELISYDEIDVLKELGNAGISGFKTMSKDAFKETIGEVAVEKVKEIFDKFGIMVVIDDVSKLGFVKAAVSNAKDVFSNALSKLNLPDISPVSNVSGAKSVLSEFFSSDIGKNVTASVIALASNLATSYFNDGQITSEEAAESVVRAGVTFAANMLGDMAVNALVGSEVIAAGSLAGGLVGILVSVGVTFVGGVIIEAIKRNIHYYPGDVPRKFERITLEDVENILEENELTLDNDILEPYFGEGSVRDICAELVDAGYPREVVQILERGTMGQDFSDLEYGEDGYWTPEYAAVRFYFTNYLDYANTDEYYLSNYIASDNTPEFQAAYLDEIHKLDAMFNPATCEYEADAIRELIKNIFQNDKLVL